MAMPLTTLKRNYWDNRREIRRIDITNKIILDVLLRRNTHP